jgi:hypothetical protein
MMQSTKEARAIGARKAAMGFLWMFLFLEALAFYVQTRDSFSEGAKEFLLMQSDKLSIGVVMVSLVTVILLGRVAGRQILVDERNHLVVALTNTLYTLLVSLAFVWVVTYFSHVYIQSWGSFVALLALVTGCVWMIAVRGIKRAEGSL